MVARSPAYPGMSIRQAIELTKKLHAGNRTNPIDREAAAKDMGFRGITGSSTKALADLTHFGLLEKAGKGGVRVTQLAVDILYPESEAAHAGAVQRAAILPALFGELRAHFADGVPSENALKSYLMRRNFVTAAIPAVVNSYLETCRVLQETGVTESHGTPPKPPAESIGSHGAHDGDTGGKVTVAATPPLSPPPPPAGASQQQKRELPVMEGERVIFVDEASAGTYLKLIACGEMDDTLLEALEDFTKRWRKRLARTAKEDRSSGQEQEGGGKAAS